MVKSSEEERLEVSVRQFLRGQLKQANVTHEQLVKKLADMGIDETKPGIANKLQRGTFPATFFIAVMKAIGRESVNVTEVYKGS